MNTRQRFVRTLTGKEVDRVPFIKVFGGHNAALPHWKQAHPEIVDHVDEILQFEGTYRGWNIAPVNLDLSSLGQPQIIEDSPQRLVQKNRAGTVQVCPKGDDFHSHIIEWPIKTRDDLDRVKHDHMNPNDPERFPDDWPDYVKEFRNRDYPLQLTHRGVYGFARNMMGDENLSYAFYDNPQLVHDLMESYTSLAIDVWEKMTADVEFDLIECWEDMAFRSGSLVSPKTFREFITPQYQRIAEFARTHNIEIILVDSDGYIEDLAELMIEAGVTTMYPFEVQSGNDIATIRKRFPNLSCIGGLNKQAMAQGKDAIDAEIEKARQFVKLGRYIPGPDHFVLSDVTWENYRYFMEKLRDVVMTTPPQQ